MHALLELVVREGTSHDRAIVANSWIRSYERKRPEMCLGLVWRRGHSQVIDRILERATVLVAELREAPGEVLGWSCHEGDVLHYAYTKRDFRGAGVCQAVVSAACATMPATIWTTHDTRDAKHVRSVVRGCGLKLKLDPWRLCNA